jgi:hypothetical protein
LTKIRSAYEATPLARPVTAWRAQNLAQNFQKSGRNCAALYLQIGVECLTILTIFLAEHQVVPLPPPLPGVVIMAHVKVHVPRFEKLADEARKGVKE